MVWVRRSRSLLFSLCSNVCRPYGSASGLPGVSLLLGRVVPRQGRLNIRTLFPFRFWVALRWQLQRFSERYPLNNNQRNYPYNHEGCVTPEVMTSLLSITFAHRAGSVRMRSGSTSRLVFTTLNAGLP